ALGESAGSHSRHRQSPSLSATPSPPARLERTSALAAPPALTSPSCKNRSIPHVVGYATTHKFEKSRSPRPSRACTATHTHYYCKSQPPTPPRTQIYQNKPPASPAPPLPRTPRNPSRSTLLGHVPSLGKR